MRFGLVLQVSRGQTAFSFCFRKTKETERNTKLDLIKVLELAS